MACLSKDGGDLLQKRSGRQTLQRRDVAGRRHHGALGRMGKRRRTQSEQMSPVSHCKCLLLYLRHIRAAVPCMVCGYYSLMYTLTIV